MIKQDKRSTIYDVAKESGVSITTVSRYLNNPESVKPATGEKIAHSMEVLDYILQGNAGSKANRPVGRIGVLTPFFPAPSFVERLRGMIPPLREKNYEVVIYTIEGPDQLDEYLSSVPFTRRLDGLILMSVHLSEEQNKTLLASGLDVVMIETDDDHYTRVLADDYRGGQIAAELFLKKNYLPCAYMGDLPQYETYSCHPAETRLQGFVDTINKEGHGLDEKMILASETIVESAKKAFETFLDKGDIPRSVFAMSDIHAMGIFKAARSRGLRVPDDLAILGFDDIEAADWMEISTISQHLGDSGRVAAGLLLDKISGKVKTIQKVNLQVVLVERLST